MTTEELIQLIRTCNLAQVRKQLTVEKRKDRAFDIIADFYKAASQQKP